jgi:hypothetical protein
MLALVHIIAALVIALSLCVCAHAAPPRLLGPPIKQGDVVDYSCHADADCAVKDVGNCCGAYPACVNRDSPTFPERVKAECAKNHMAGTCGFPVIEGCACVEGRCSSASGRANPTTD